MVHEMDTTEYIKWLKTFKFSDEQKTMLLAIPPKAVNKTKLSIALPLIEKRINEFFFDYRKENQDGLLDVSLFLEGSCLEADRVCNSIETLLENFEFLDHVKSSRLQLLALSAALSSYRVTLTNTKQFDVGEGLIERGRPRKHYLRWLAIDIGSCLTESGLKITRSKVGLFCQVYSQIAQWLGVELAEPTNYLEEAISHLKAKD